MTLFAIDFLLYLQTVDKLKNELERNNISIIAVEGFEQRGNLSFQMEKLKVIYLLLFGCSCLLGITRSKSKNLLHSYEQVAGFKVHIVFEQNDW